MEDSDIPIDQAKALADYFRQAGMTADQMAKSIGRAQNPLKAMADLAAGVADNLKRTDEFTQELIKDLAKVGTHLNMANSTTAKINENYKGILAAATKNEKIERDLQSLLMEEIQTREDMVLQATMLETGLEGVYAQMAAQLNLNKEILIDKSKQIGLEAELVSITQELVNLEGMKKHLVGESLENTINKINTQTKLLNDKKEELKIEEELNKTGEREYQDQVKLLQNRQAQNKVIEKQVSFVKQVAAETLKIKEQTDAYKKKFEGLLATTKAIFSSPAAFFTTVAVALTAVGEKFSATFSKLQGEGLSTGQAVTGTFNAYSTSISNLGNISVEEVGQATTALVGMGQTLHQAEEGVNKVADMMTLMGGSAEETGKAFGFLQTMPGQTEASAENIMRMGGAMAKVANVPAATVTQAIAKNMGAAALAGPKLMKSFAEAAIFAKKIGVEMSVFDSMAKGLLSFEESINRQMEASVLLGREINLDKARELALAGDLKGVQHEILKVVGSEADFNKMNRLQKEALAASMSLEVTDLQKIIAGKGEETALGKKSLELEEEKAGAMQKIGLFLAKNAGATMSGIASLIAGIATMIPQIMTYNLLKAQSTAITAVNTPVTTTNAMSIRAAGVAAKGAAMSMLAFGAAALMIGGGVFLAAVGIAQLATAMKGLSLPEFLGLAAILVGIGVGLFFLSKMAVIAAPELAAGGAALTVFGVGVLYVGLGIGIVIGMLALLVYSVTTLVETLGKLSPGTLSKVSTALYSIAGGLGAMTMAGIGAIPLIGALMGLAGVSDKLGKIGGLGLPSLGNNNKTPAASKESSDGGSFKEVKDALVNLTTAVKGIRGDVILDGPKVGSAIWTYVQTKIVQEQKKTQG
jgi:hypothetical protein